jgi:hypothetical protein
VTPPAQSEGREGREWTIRICAICGVRSGNVHQKDCFASGEWESVVVVPKADRDSLRAENERLRGLMEAAFYATLPMLPIEGSAEAGYHISQRIHHRVAATPEEWATAADAMLYLAAALASLPAAGQEAGR